MNALSEPLGMRHAQPVGRDELGRPLYRLPTGQIVGMEPPQQRNALAAQLRTELDAQGRAIHYQDELQPTRTGNTLAGIAGGVLSGVTAPGRAAGGEAVSLGDTWATALDWGALAAPMPAPPGAVRAGAMRSAEGPADEIARMLREGRASEITDDMMAALSPEDNAQLFRLYQEGATGQAMPMDEASRMQRARDMGFDTDTPLYHGTSSRIDFSRFQPSSRGRIGPGVYLADEPRLASAFSGIPNDILAAHPSSMNPNARVLPVVATNRPATAEVRTAARTQQRLFDDPYSDEATQAFSDVVRDGGFDGIRVQDQRTVTDPRNIRSRFARFDPRLSHLAHLSAGGAGVAVLGGQGEQGGYEDSLRRYLQEIGQ